MRFKLSAFVLLLLAGFLAAGAPSAQDNLRVGILLDGPFDRNQDVTANIMRTARAALEGTRNVTFPDASRITGDWTGSAAKAGLDRLLADDGVDVIFTLGVLGSHEAASRKNLSKPVIAPYIVQPEWLKVPSSTRGDTFSQQYRVSGVRNLAYVTEVGVGLVDAVGLFQQVTPFQKVVVLAAEPIQELTDDMEGGLRQRLAPLGLEDIQVIYVKDSIAAPLRAIPEDVGAAIVTQLPQMEATEFQQLATTLVEMKIPAYTLGTRREVELGMLAGVVAPSADDLVAQRVAELLKQIAEGKNAAELPTELAVEESLSFNSAVAAALGIVSDDGTLKTATRVPGTADGRKPAMKPVDVTTVNQATTADQEEMQRIAMEVNRGIARIPEYSAFDAISTQVRGRTVILLGWAWRPSTAASAERIAQRTKGVESVENNIEVLPTSNNDDRLRGEIFAKIYSQPTMQRYLQGGGLSRFDIQRTLQDLRFGLESVQIVRGPQAVHILVRNGHVALMGNVSSNLQRQVAEQQAQTTAGVFSVENHIQVAGG